MARQLLPVDVTPEDRLRGCVWASVFRSAADEVEKRGAITGAPTIDHGITLDGTADYVAYALNGSLDEADLVSYHCIFYPDFTPAAVMTERSLFDSTVTLHYISRFQTNGVWQFRLGNVSIVNVALATYSGLFVVGGRNVVTLSGTTGATDVWFNGTQIVTADISAWTPTNPTALNVGVRGLATGFFDGRITLLKFYDQLLTAGEHDDLWAGGGA